MNNLRKKEINIKKRGVKTPLFMPDATRGLVKMLSSNELKKTGVEAVVVNTFHLYLNPGTQIIKKSDKTKRNYKKGIHVFMDWDGLVLSDSGGFQVFSLIHKNPKMGRIYEDRVEFISPWDGSRHKLTPEKSIQIQFDLGVDMMVCLDDCPPNNYNKSEIKKSITRTLNWAQRCREEYEKQIKLRKIGKKERPLLFGVVQGGGFPDLREKCTKELVNIGFDGYGFGARPIDDKGNFLSQVLEETANNIPVDAWRFALGIGLPEDIIRCARMGWDIFDCVIPSREGRHGKLFQFKNIEKEIPKKGNYKNIYNVINIKNSKYKNSQESINIKSKIKELRNYSKAYLNYLFKIKDPLAYRLASLNNLEFYIELMNKLKI